MFTTIIVPIDAGAGGERALPVARALHALGDVKVEWLTVRPPSAGTDTAGTGREGAAGWPFGTRRVLAADDVAGAIAAEVNARPDALLVMATSAKPPLLGHLLGSVSEAVLRLVERPVLLVGPHVPAELHWSRPTPIVCVRSGTAAPDTVAAVSALEDTFAMGVPRIVEIVPEAERRSPTTDEDRSTRLGRMAAELAVGGIDARVRVYRGGVPEVRLEEVADHVVQPLFVVASARWMGGRHMWSTTRQLVHRSSRPVLVVPDRSDVSVDPDREAIAVEPVDVLVP